MSGMDQETLSFYNWQLEQDEVEQIKAAMRRADSGPLIDPAKLKEMAAGWCKIEPSKLDEVVITGRKDARINWSDATFTMCSVCASTWRQFGFYTTGPTVGLGTSQSLSLSACSVPSN